MIQLASVVFISQESSDKYERHLVDVLAFCCLRDRSDCASEHLLIRPCGLVNDCCRRIFCILAAGEKMTGVTVMRMGIGMDDGPILLQAFEPIYQDDTSETLMDRLAISGGVNLAKALKLMAARQLPPPTPQVDEEATFAYKYRKTDGLVDWAQPSVVIERRIRAFTPWPGCYTFLPVRFRKKDTGRLVISGAEFATLDPAQRSELPGTVLAVTARGPVVRTADTALLLTALKPEGSRMMDGGAFLRGRPLKPLSDMFLAK